MNNLKRIIGKIVLGLVILIFVIGAIAVIRLPRIPDDLNRIALSTPTKIYDDQGRLIQMLSNRQVVPLEDISEAFLRAVLALEDDDFYSHHGISKRGLLRAIFTNIRHGRVVQGGSTITQQLAKNLFFTFRRSYLRKIQEVFVTLQIEQQFTKDEILEAYVNQIDFGSGIYGIELAAQTYFSKHADELTLAEASMLAGIPRWPARYNPYKNPEIANERQAFVLKRMHEENYITDKEREQAKTKPLDFKRIYDLYGHADYFVNQVIKEASNEYGRNAVMYGGLLIQTTLNSSYQYTASQAVKEGLVELDDMLGLAPYDSASWEEKLNYPQAALVAIDPQTGAIKAMIGGRDPQRAPYNRAVAQERSPGSSFKMFTYLAALDKNLVNPTTVMVDEPVSFQIYDQVWEPQNYEKDFIGPLTLKMALAKSVNVIAAKLIDRVGPETVVDYAKKMGITSELKPHYSLALGATGVSPKEMASAYGTLANQGVHRKPFMIRQIDLSENKMLQKHEMKSRRVVDPQTCYVMVDMLRSVIEMGTGQAVRSRGFYRPCAGKTGTTNDYRDAWFIGFTPNLVCAVWVGFDDNRQMRTKYGRGVTGAHGALPIWTIFMKQALKNKPYADFPIPPGIQFIKVNPTTGEEVSTYNEGLPVAVRRRTR